jgi:RNA polymerase sigma-54 factor
MKLGLDLRTTLSQTLTPQQIQYLKLLQLPLIQLEQHIRQEIDENPMLDEIGELEFSAEGDDLDSDLGIVGDDSVEGFESSDENLEYIPNDSIALIKENQIKEDESIDIFKSLYSDEPDYSNNNKSDSDDDDGEPFQIKAHTSFIEEIEKQFNMLDLSDEQKILGTHIIGNIDDDGYLRRELNEIVDEANSTIADFNFRLQKEDYERKQMTVKYEHNGANPALAYRLAQESIEQLKKADIIKKEDFSIFNDDNLIKQFDKTYTNGNGKKLRVFTPVNMNDAEMVLKQIQELDPPGIGSRTIKECLLAQCNFLYENKPGKHLAIRLLNEAYEPFIKKHYPVIIKQLGITESQLREAIDFIKTLNPKPGAGDFQSEMNTVIPDFTISKDPDTQELYISVNDSRIPSIRLSQAYAHLKKEARQKKFNKDTRTWIRNKYEEAKFLIQAIQQRKATMLKVMTAIAGKQREFFHYGHSALRPLIYKDIAEATSLDISTVCRIVNGKYVQTDFGTFELKFFFSESLPSDEGDEISTTVIKQTLKEVIEAENKSKPYSDDKLSSMLKEHGYNVARRTVAKYREQLKIPVARLRKEI